MAVNTAPAPLGTTVLQAYSEATAPRYTSYPTAAQFHDGVGASAQAAWLQETPRSDPLSLYIHIPFCRRLCLYCGCAMRAVRTDKPIVDYVDVLLKEAGLVADLLGDAGSVHHLHLGGGSPNTLLEADLKRLLETLRARFTFTEDAQIAAEIDPGHVTPGWIDAAASLGLNRASLGVQTFSRRVQDAINRRQPYEVVARVVAELRRAGVGRINFDLMYGLPEQTVEDVLEAVDLSLRLNPDRLAIFGYAHVPKMKAHQRLLNPASLPGAAVRIRQMEAAEAAILAAGFVKIGLDHYARPEDEMARAQTAGQLHRNFQGYTCDDAPTLIGLGASAISRLKGGFVQNSADVNTWRAAVSSGSLAGVRGVEVGPRDRLRSAIIERLMCDGRADVGRLCAEAALQEDILNDSWSKLDVFRAQGLVELRDKTVLVTQRGAALVRVVCTAFDDYFDAAGGRHSKAV